MRYNFLRDHFSDNKGAGEDVDLIEKFRQNQRYRFGILAFTFILCYYIMCTFLIAFISKTYLAYIHLGGLVEAIIFGIMLVFSKNNKKKFIILKYFIFCMLLFVKYYYVIYLIVSHSDRLSVTRNLYVVLIYTNFYLLIVLKFNYYFLIVVSCLNFGLTIFAQIYYKDPQGVSYVFAVEIVMSFLVSVSCFILRREYELMMSAVKSNMSYNLKIMEYTDNLIDQQPCSFFTYSQGNIVYVNSTFQKFLTNNLDSTVNHLLQTEPLRSDINQNEVHLLVKSNMNESKIRALEFLSQNRMIYTEPILHELFEKKIGSSLSLVNIICNLEMINEIDNNGKFQFLGISSYFSQVLQETIFHSINFRKITNGDLTWIEMSMTDITTTKKIQSMDEIYKMKESLLKKIAHEFKTPLMCICSLSESVIADCPEMAKSVKVKLAQMSDLSNHTLFLVNDIISYLSNKGNTSSNEIMIQCKNFKLSEILNFGYRILKTLLIYNNNKIGSITPAFEVGMDAILFTDQSRFKQILLNLISNAIKFTNNGEIKISAELINTNLQKSILISIEDTGLGIKDEDKCKVFGEGNMLKTHLANNNMGSGLGLSISHNLAKNMGMNLTFQSVYKIGSKFTLEIPIEGICSNVENIGFEKDTSFVPSNCEKTILNIDKSDIKLMNDISHSLSRLNERFSIKSEETLNRNFLVDFPSLSQLLQNFSRPTRHFTTLTLDGGRQKRSKFKKNNILIIDDNSWLIESLKKSINTVLSKNGCDIDIISGSDGVDLLKEIINEQKSGNTIKCVFIDKNMQYMNGDEAVKLARLWENDQKISRKFICGYSGGEDFKENDLLDFAINKPANLEEVEKVLALCNLISI